jgi:hypothetical protein
VEYVGLASLFILLDCPCFNDLFEFDSICKHPQDNCPPLITEQRSLTTLFPQSHLKSQYCMEFFDMYENFIAVNLPNFFDLKLLKLAGNDMSYSFSYEWFFTPFILAQEKEQQTMYIRKLWLIPAFRTGINTNRIFVCWYYFIIPWLVA